MTKIISNQFHSDIANQIVELWESEGLKVGDRVTERNLASQLDVSRSPIRGALTLLVQHDVIEHIPNSGYKLKIESEQLSKHFKIDQASDTEKLYERILKDRFTEVIPKHLSERDCMKRYDVTRGQLLKVFLRLSNEGLIHRAKGYGWLFVDMLVNAKAYEASYELRLAIEPAALQVQGFQIDEDKLERCYLKHKKVLEKGTQSISSSDLFDLDAEMHELLMSFSGNPYFLQTIQNQNSLRRVVEYQSIDINERTEESCKEHLEILDALRNGKRELASTLLTRHLYLASEAQKTFENK